MPAVWLTAGFAVLTLVPLLALAYFAITRSSAAVEREATARVESTAAVGADFVDAELAGLAALVEGYATRPSLVAALADGDPARYDRPRIAFHLAELQRAAPGIAVTFLARPSGHLVDVVPPTPEILGEDFSFRDWYRGVTAVRGPYVSEAYVTAASNREAVTAAATLVRGGAPERTLGILVAAYSLEHIQSFAERLQRDEGMGITITDQAGVVVASPHRQDELVSIAGDARVQAAIRGEHGVSTHSGEDGGDVAAYAPVPAFDWTVTASVPRQTAFASVRELRDAVLSITALLGLLLAAGVAALGLTLRRRAQLEKLERASRIATEEARSELESQNVELETQTVELETQAAELEESQTQLAAANDELEAQQAELQEALAALGDEKERLETLYAFVERIAEETRVEALASLLLEHIAAAAAAEIGVVHVLNQDGGFEVVAARGVAAEGVVPVVPGVGLAGRALEEECAVTGDHGESGFTLETFGEQARIRRELHLPLVHAGRCLGVCSLGRLADRDLSPAEHDAVEHLADQATVALANALALRDVRRLAKVNRAVLDATTDAIRMVDHEGRTLVANTAMKELAGSVLALDEDLTIWETTADLAERTTDPSAYLHSLRLLQDDPEREAVDVYQLAADGTWIQRYSAPVRDGDRGVVGRIFVLRDVTAEREAQQLKSELVATVSHELRTPLTGILGFAELLTTQELDAVSQRTYIETIHREAQRLHELVNDFLDVQRIEEGDFRLVLQPVALDELVRQQATVFDTHSLHRLELDVEEGIVVLGERDRITQVLTNLLSNAVKYSPEGGTVRVGVRGAGASVRVEVADSGIGIPAGQQRRIFERFFRVDSSDARRIGGTGLGLALCREIVEAHGGTIGFSSTEGLGSTFWFELPRVEHDAAAAPAARQPRVLVVEDNPGTTELLREHLLEDGYDVEVALTGEEALARVEQSPPAVICLDIGLPGALDGWEVLTRLKSNPATASVPVLVCTGGERGDRALALGAADFVTKPFSRERLLDVVARLVPDGCGSILVVDDEPTIRRFVTTTLARDGLELHEAADGEAALESIAERRPDVIVLDLAMPVLDGFGVLERLLDDPETRTIPVIVLTARNVTSEERKWLCERTANVLEKSSYSAHALRRLVRQAAAA
ncbi:MAG TPA: response regulator [Gaiellaceae bacterium]|nr:response regulator [Gaiellaceae bacterium]